jgi:hypothetical protein
MPPHDLSQSLSREWATINYSVFGGALVQPPTIEIAEHLHHHLGDWNATSRTIRFSLAFVTERPWWVVVEVLKHEMAHQYVSDVLGIEDEETAHGPAFRMVCERYAIDGRAGHKPTDEETRIVEKARKLLALTASPNEHEAQAALSAVQRLLGHHGLAEEDVRERDAEEFGALVLGPIIPKIQIHHSGVASILAAHFHVRPIWTRARDPRTNEEGSQLEVNGRRRDLAMAEYVHDWLHRVAEQLCPPSHSRKERLDFLAGVVVGHQTRLDADAKSAQASANGFSVALIKSDATDSTLNAYFHRRHPRTRTSRGSGRRLGSSFLDGQSAGRSLAMHRPISGGGPKLLK